MIPFIPARPAAPTPTLLSSHVVYASRAGVPLNSNLQTGGGTDATAALNAILSTAPALGGLELIIDGPALVSGLTVYSNTTIRFLPGGGLFLLKGSGRPLIENAHPIGAAVTAGPNSPQHNYVGGPPIDTNIRIVGPGVLNGNRAGGASGGQGATFQYCPTLNHDGRNTKGEFVPGLRITGCTDLRIGDELTIVDACTYAVQLSNVDRFRVEGLTVRSNILVTTNTDGVHLNGPATHGVIRGCHLATGDDAIALNANDSHMSDFPGVYPLYVTWGPITDVDVSEITLDRCVSAIRVLSSISAVDRVSFRGFRGTVTYRAIIIDDDMRADSNGGWTGAGGGAGVGAVGSVLIDDFKIEPSNGSGAFDDALAHFGCLARRVTIRNLAMLSPGAGPLLTVDADANIDLLRLENCTISDSAGAATAPLLDVPAGSITRLEVSNLAWTRPGQTGTSSVPAVRVSGGSVGSAGFAGVAVDGLSNVFACTAGSTGAISSSLLRHTNAAGGASFSLGSSVARLRASCSDTALLLSGTVPTSKKTDATEDQ